MARFIVIQEKVVGTKVPNYAVKDTTNNHVGFRTADKTTAEHVASQANLQGSE